MKKIWKIRTINCILWLHAKLSQIDRKKQPLSKESEFKRIVIFSTTALGDFLFNTPAIRALKQRYPDAKVMLVSSQKNLKLVQGSAWFDQIAVWDNKIARAPKLIHELRKFQPQAAFLLHSRHGYDTLCARFGGARYIIRDNFRFDSPLLNKWLDLHSEAYEGHIIQRKLDLISALGCSDKDIRMQFPVVIKKEARSVKEDIIGFQMGASEDKRCWPVEHFAALAEKIFQDHPLTKIVLTGSPKDHALESRFFALLPAEIHSNITSYIGKTDLQDLIELISSLKCLVTGDTGPLHIAVTAGTPTVSLYVDANPDYTGPYQDPHLHKTIRIEPAKNDDALFPMKKISVEQVYNAIF